MDPFLVSLMNRKTLQDQENVKPVLNVEEKENAICWDSVSEIIIANLKENQEDFIIKESVTLTRKKMNDAKMTMIAWEIDNVFQKNAWELQIVRDTC